MAQSNIEREEIRDINRGNWDKIEKEWEKIPSNESYIKRIAKHIKAFKAIAKDIEKALANLPERYSATGGGYLKDEPLLIRGGDGKGEPHITDTIIRFNGDESTGMDHETFILELFDMSFNYDQEQMSKDGVFSFCKTARKPYDLLVCISLMVAKHHLGKDFKISSDGGLDEWKPAIEFYEETFKRKAPNELMAYFKKEEAEA